MGTFAKTKQTALAAIQSVSASTVLISSEFDMSTKLGGNLQIRFGRTSATAAGAGVNIRCESSSETSGNNSWFPFAIIPTAFAACESEALTGTVSSGQKVLTLASTTNLTAGDLIFIKNSTFANSEWARIKSIVSNTSVTIEDNLVNAQTSSTIYDSAEIFPIINIPESAMRIRVVFDGSLFTQTFAVHCGLITIDSFS